MNINDRRRAYKKLSENYFEKEENGISTICKNNSCNYISEMLFLIKNIPEWNIYLNDKQILIVKMFVNYKNVSDVATIMNLSYGTVYSALFGSTIKDGQGIYGKLKKVYSLSNKYNAKNGTIGEMIVTNNSVVNEIKRNNENVDFKESLFKYINAIDNWRDYLNEQQIKIVELYLEHKSCSKVDKILGKNSTWGILYGKTKTNPKGVYKKLEMVYNNINK